jgi:hypothetical protein
MSSGGTREPWRPTKGLILHCFHEVKAMRKGRSNSKCSNFQKGKNQLFNFTSEFLDLIAIDKLTSMGIQHLQISVSQLHMVGQEVCGLLPSEVAVDRLLQPKEAGSSGRGDKQQEVVNG